MPFRIIRQDITKIHADALVNSANPQPVYGRGTDSAVYEAAGADKLLAARRQIGAMAPGQAEATPAFALPARYLIHTVAPGWRGGGAGEEETLRQCYVNSLALAEKLGCESIAFPLLGTGFYRYPREAALRLAVGVFHDWLEEHETDITLAVFDNESFRLSGAFFEGVESFLSSEQVRLQLEKENARRVREEFMAFRDRRRYEEAFEAAFEEKAPSLNDSFGRDAEAPAGMPKPAAEKAARGAGRAAARRDSKAGPAESRPGADRAETPGGAFRKKRSLDDVVRQVGETFQQSLLRLIDEKGYTDPQVYRAANVDRKLFSKIRSNVQYRPKKETALAFALALKLSLDETRDLLSRAGYAFSPGSVTDLIVEYCIENGVYKIDDINLALFAHGQPMLGYEKD